MDVNVNVDVDVDVEVGIGVDDVDVDVDEIVLLDAFVETSSELELHVTNPGE